MKAVIKALSLGEITPDQGQKIAGVVKVVELREQAAQKSVWMIMISLSK